MRTTSGLESEAKLPVPLHTVMLRVTGGVHQGVSLPLEKTSFSIGSKPSADILLGDPGIAPEHGVVRVQNGAAVVEAHGGEIGIGNHHRLAQGRGCRISLPVELRIGGARLQIARPAPASRPSGWTTPRVATIGACCGALLLLASVFATNAGFRLPSTTDGLGTPQAARDAAPPMALQAIAASAAGTPAAPGADVQTAREALGAKLQESGLGDIATTVDGMRIVASGAIAAERRGDWGEVQRWFDRTFGGRQVLASAVETRPPFAKPKFDLQAISFGATPYVITADGQRRYPGAVLDQGWLIKEIRAGQLILTKDGKDFTLTF